MLYTVGKLSKLCFYVSVPFIIEQWPWPCVKNVTSADPGLKSKKWFDQQTT